MANELTALLAALDEAYGRTAWHGPNLRSAIRGVTPALAAWRPAPRHHNIWEIVVHATYWKHVVTERLTGERRPFPFAGSDWFERPGGGRSWTDDVRLLEQTHRRLRAAVAARSPRTLERRVFFKRQRAAFNIRGIAAHDVYHAGQIQLIKALKRR